MPADSCHIVSRESVQSKLVPSPYTPLPLAPTFSLVLIHFFIFSPPGKFDRALRSELLKNAAFGIARTVML